MDIKVPAMGESVTEGNARQLAGQTRPGRETGRSDRRNRDGQGRHRGARPRRGRDHGTPRQGRRDGLHRQDHCHACTEGANRLCSAYAAATPGREACRHGQAFGFRCILRLPLAKATDKIAPSVGRIAAESGREPCRHSGHGQGRTRDEGRCARLCRLEPCPGAGSCARARAAEVPHTPRVNSVTARRAREDDPPAPDDRAAPEGKRRTRRRC